jgi:hypothetical protein
MRALCLWEVNLPDERSGEDQEHEGVTENGGDFRNGLIECGIVTAHERSPWKTTHDDLHSRSEEPQRTCREGRASLILRLPRGPVVLTEKNTEKTQHSENVSGPGIIRKQFVRRLLFFDYG